MTWLIRQGLKFIFYPCVPYERNEFPDAGNHYNCPIVTSYAENIKNNIDELHGGDIDFVNPFLSFESEKILEEALIREFGEHCRIPAEEIAAAAKKAWKEQENVREDIKRKGEETLKYMEETGHRGIVLAGRPYHIDPEINHGIPELINSYGIAVLTEDSISHLHGVERPLFVMDQWMYPVSYTHLIGSKIWAIIHSKYILADDGRHNMEQDSGKIIQVKAKRSPVRLQRLSQRVVQIHTDQEKQEPCIGRIDNKSKQPPYLPVHNGHRIPVSYTHLDVYKRQKHYNVALSHAAKKLVRLIFAMEKSGQAYVPAA